MMIQKKVHLMSLIMNPDNDSNDETEYNDKKDNDEPNE